MVSDAKMFQNSFGCINIASPYFPQPHIVDIKWHVNSTVIWRTLILSALRVIGFSVSGSLRKISSELQYQCLKNDHEFWKRERKMETCQGMA